MNNIKYLFVLLASLILGACSSDDDSKKIYTMTHVSEAPVWKVDWTYNQTRPAWTEPDATKYENWTTLMVQIEETLQPFVSDGDMMALFVNGELRGLASPAVIVGSEESSSTKFLMKAYGNETGTETVNMSLQYYNDRLKHIFTLTDDINLDSDISIGIDEDYIAEFTFGSAKYPVVKTVVAESLLSENRLPATAGNIVGVFVGEECRGTVTLSSSGNTPLVIYGRKAGESVTLKYYEAARGILHSVTEAMKM